MARTPVMAAGGIVLRRETPPRFAVVRLRKRNEWVLPKGKLDDGETPRAAAEREVLEETGHAVDVHEFLGTLVYESGGRSKVVHYWRMDAGDKPVRGLMNDVRAVDWLPLDEALERLSRGYERAFLENVGPIALQAAALAERTRRARARAVAAEKRRRLAAELPVVTDPPAVTEASIAETPVLAETPTVVDTPVVVQAGTDEQAALPSFAQESVMAAPDVLETEQIVHETAPVEPPSFAPDVEPVATEPEQAVRKNLIQWVRDWLRRAA
ncbi:NUDIX hydrolase [Bradyrhizobium jicamae]|nr:NUDIX hydrolase [Bradyrhizobium jicamae]MBR0936949.1 NUDIX hydrolase [Bradyrhizobium jicamae]